MASRWAACAVSLALALSACGGKSMNRADTGNQAGSSGSSAGGAISSSGAAPDPSSGGSADAGPLLSTSQWRIRFPLGPDSLPPWADLHCTNVLLNFDLIDHGDTLQAFLGEDGSMVETTFVHSLQRDSIELASSFVFQPSSDQPCATWSYQFDSLILLGLDFDNDGQFDHLQGNGAGSVDVTFSDMGAHAAMVFNPQAVTDLGGPVLNVSLDPANPLDPIVFEASEPLKTAKLYLDGPVIVTFAEAQAGAPLIRLTSDLVLPLGQTWQLAGSATDFAGYGLLTGGDFSTLRNPGFFAQDGFEGPAAVVLTGNAQVIDPTYGVAIPNGTHALLVAPDGSATMHLTSPTPGVKTLSLQFSELFTDPVYVGSSGNVALDAAVVGGSKRVHGALAATGPTTAVNAARWKAASTTSTLVLPLSEPGSDVLVRFSSYSCQQLPCPAIGLVIDDLTLK